MEPKPSDRNREQMEELEKLLLLRLKDFEKFPKSERIKICSVMRFDAYPKVLFLFLSNSNVLGYCHFMGKTFSNLFLLCLVWTIGYL